MIGGGDDGQWRNRRHRQTIDGAPVDRGGRMRTMRPGRGLRGTTIVGDVSQQWAVARQKAKVDGKQKMVSSADNPESVAIALAVTLEL